MIRLMFLYALLSLSGCGAADFGAKSSQSSGASAVPTASTKASTTGLQGFAPVVCPGVAPHGDHETCDSSDDEVEATGLTPAPASASAAPALTPAEASVTQPPMPTPTIAAAAPQPAATPAPTPAAVATATSTKTDPNVVEFHIAAGTGTSGYNTAAKPVTVKVGQTLRLINDDTVNHRLHTGGAPCPHQPNNTPPGGSFDCIVTQAINAKGAVYDHIAGPTSVFYLNATE